MQADPDLTRTVLVTTKLDTKLPQFSEGDDLEDFLRSKTLIFLSLLLMLFYFILYSLLLSFTINLIHFHLIYFNEILSNVLKISLLIQSWRLN